MNFRNTIYNARIHVDRNDGTIQFFFFSFFFSKEDLINHSIQYVQRGAISRWYYFFFFFFLFQKSRAMEDLYQCIISYFSLLELMISLYSFVSLFFSFFFFPFSFLFRETQYFFYFSFASLYKGTV